MLQIVTLLSCMVSANAIISSRTPGPTSGLNPATPSFGTGRINGWLADGRALAWGLPGSIAPIENFDPLDLSKGCSLDEAKRLREAEVTHGRVAMLASVGIPTAERFHPLFGGRIDGPAIHHLDAVRAVAPSFFECLAITIGIAEMGRALIGWNPPNEFVGKRFLRSDYYPGDVGFDPLGLKPTDAAEFADIQTKELQHGRLAMLAVVGMVAQELATNAKLFE